jgi:hypothetical protein
MFRNNYPVCHLYLVCAVGSGSIDYLHAFFGTTGKIQPETMDFGR